MSAALDRLANLVEARFGLALDETRRHALAEQLDQRPKARRLGASAYVDELERTGRDGTELAALAAEVTVGETYFFRHTEQLHAFTHVALQNWQRSQRAMRPLRVLSAGCASGEEAYTLAILACESGMPFGAQIEIVGIDLNLRSIERAERAHYSPWSLRETTESIRSRYFRKTGNGHALLRERLPSVRFAHGNLLDSKVLDHESFDVVFCRNVLMYFTQQKAAATVRRLWASLRPNGHLFLGHAENLRGLSDDFHLHHTHGAFYYERKLAHEPALAVGDQRNQMAPHEPTEARPSVPARTDWLEVVDESTKRIFALSLRGSAPSAKEPPPAASGTQTLARVLGLVEQERFHHALLAIDELEDLELDGDLLLVRAALLTHSGQLALAEQACHRLLAASATSAAVHYLLGLLDERRGHDAQSTEHMRTAGGLDSTFAMPHLHLGLGAARSGDPMAARTSLNRAARLLEQEAPLHLLLFGGGFQRAGLIQLCQAELSRLGGAP